MYTFSCFALKTVKVSTLQCNQGKGCLQKGGFISTRMRSSYFNISLALKRPFSLIVSEQVSIYSVYTVYVYLHKRIICVNMVLVYNQ